MARPTNDATVADIMQCDVLTVTPDMTVSRASRIMATHGIRHLVVTDADGKSLGVFSERDLLRHTIHELGFDRSPGEALVADIMQGRPVTIRIDARLMDVSSLLATRKIGCLPVVDNSNELVGIISVVDVLKHFGGAIRDDDFLEEGRACEETAADIQTLVADFEMVRTMHEAHSDRLVSLVNDLDTEKKRANEALRAKEDFIANIGHELRTPITAVTGFANLLADTDLTDEQTEFLKHIQDCSVHLLEQINDILDFSKIIVGRLDVERIHVSPVETVQDVLSSMQPQADSRGITLHTTMSGRIPNRIDSDPTRLRQILFNLANNAVKFTKQGSVQVEICLIESEGCEPLIRFVVQDTGIGMTKEQLSTIFEPFTQADTSTTRKHGGTGLGLAISRHLTELLGGTISVASAIGEGSTFTLTIPTGSKAGVDLDDAKSDFETFTDDTRGESLRDCRILVCEDDPVIQSYLRIFLSRAGAKVSLAENGHAAVQSVENADSDGDPFDVILMDMVMPECDGFTATCNLRQSGCRIPIIAVTAKSSLADRERCKNAGCDEYISKPVNQTFLTVAILKLWRRRVSA